MNTEQQDKLWNELSEETQQEYREKYKFHLADSKREMKCKDGGYDLTVLRSETIVKELETMFGSHNLNPKPTPKTWEDVEKGTQYIKEQSENINNSLEPCICFDEKISDKMIATYKIAKLIDFGYGGMVSEEEWRDNSVEKWCIIPCNKIDDIQSTVFYFHSDKRFIAFHTEQQAEEFMSYESNRRLVEQYYMM